MNFHNLRQYFVYTKSQRLGITTLLSIILILQLLYFFIDFTPAFTEDPEKERWLSLQPQIDSLSVHPPKEVPKIYPFNPNFITDFKGYRLGMSVEEIDRLLKFRQQGKYVNSAPEFQRVTKISDSLLAVIAPRFKFPDWVMRKSKRPQYNTFNERRYAANKITVRDINKATKEELMEVFGVGPALSERILKQRNLFGSFVSMEQMQDVWGLSPEVLQKLKLHFAVAATPNVRKIAINEISLNELAAFPYFGYKVAKGIITFRSMNGKITHIDDLAKINGFPVEKIKIIALYLEL